MMSVNKYLMTSGCIAALTATVHTFSGTPEIQEPLFQSSIDQRVVLLLYICWHMVTVVLILSAVFLIYKAQRNTKRDERALPFFIAVLWISFGLVFISVSIIFFGPSGLLILPQWLLLIPVGIFALFGSTKEKKQCKLIDTLGTRRRCE